MSKQVKKIVRTGSWLYAGGVRMEVWIIKQNFLEGPKVQDEEVESGYPACDESGFFYYAAYGPGKIRSISKLCRSEQEAVEIVQNTLKGSIKWRSSFLRLFGFR